MFRPERLTRSPHEIRILMIQMFLRFFRAEVRRHAVPAEFSKPAGAVLNTRFVCVQMRSGRRTQHTWHLLRQVVLLLWLILRVSIKLLGLGLEMLDYHLLDDKTSEKAFYMGSFDFWALSNHSSDFCMSKHHSHFQASRFG